MENYNKEMENKLLEMIRQKEEADKRLLALEWVLGVLSIIILLVPCAIAAYVEMEEWKRVLVAFSGFIPAFIGLGFAMKIEQVAGYYACRECGHRYVPTFKAVNMAMHIGRTRYMKCPQCGKRTWQKKVLTKE